MINHIIIKFISELNNLPDSFAEYTEIIIDVADTINKIDRLPGNSMITLVGKTTVKYLYVNVDTLRGNSRVGTLRENSRVGTLRENSRVDTLWENSQVGTLRENSRVGELWENSRVGELWENSQVGELRGNSRVDTLRGNSQVGELRENSRVDTLWENSRVGTLRENSRVGTLWGNSRVDTLRGNSRVGTLRENSRVGTLWENSQVGNAFENSIIVTYSNKSKIGRLKHNAILICQSCNVEIQEKDDTAQVIFTKATLHNIKTFSDIYKDNLIDNDYIILYKSVAPEAHCDFYTGKIIYNGIVVCPDWDNNPERECGGGLHLSPTPELALSYNNGKLLKCKVKLSDIAVYPYNVTKVRCREVEVIGEVYDETR